MAKKKSRLWGEGSSTATIPAPPSASQTQQYLPEQPPESTKSKFLRYAGGLGLGVQESLKEAKAHPGKATIGLGKALVAPAAALTIFPEAGVKSTQAAYKTVEALVKRKGMEKAGEAGSEAFGGSKWLAEKYFGTEVGKAGAKWYEIPYKDPAARQIIGEAMTAPLFVGGVGGAGAGGKAALGATRLARATQGAKAGAKVGAKLGPPLGAIQTYEEGDIRKLPQNIAIMTAGGALMMGGIGGATGLLRRAPKIGIIESKLKEGGQLSAEEQVALDYAISKGTKLREATPQRPLFKKVAGGILDVEKGEVIPINNYKDNIPTLKGIKVKEGGEKVVGFNSDGTAITVDNTFNKERVKRAFKYLRDEQGQWAGRESLGAGGVRTLYHGTSQGENIAKNGFRGGWLTPDKNIAQRYGQVIETKVPESQLVDIREFKGNIQSQNDLSAFAKKYPNKFGLIDRSPTGNINEDLVFPFPGRKPVGVGGVGGEQFRLKDDFQKATGVAITDQQEQQIIALNKKMFGDENIKITGQILTPQGQEALGSYRDGMIKVLGGQAKATDTFYHEAVHKYLDVFTSASEQADILLQAQKRFGTANFAATEEKLAESFITYASGQEKASPFKAIFDKVITRIKSYFGNEDTVKMFYNDVLGGKVAKPKGALPAVAGKALPKAEPTSEEILALTEPTYMTPEKMMRRDDIKLAQKRQIEIINEEAAAMRAVEEEAAVGLKPTAEGGYIRTTEHSAEYRQYYADKGRKPTMAFYKDLAKKNLESGRGQAQEEYNIVRDVVNAPEIGALPPSPAEAIPTTRVPGTVLPVGEGKTKVSRLAQRITKRLEDLDEETKAAVPTYQVMNKADQIAKAAEFVEMYPDEAMAVLKGDKAPPQGLLRNSIGLALEEKAVQDGDAEMARNLASLYSTRAGQEISILTERDPNSPVKYIADVQKARIEARGGQEAVSRSTREEAVKIQSEIIKTAPKKQDWAGFIESLRCK